MKYQINKIEETVCQWGTAPAQWVVSCIKEKDNDDALLGQIIDYESKRGIWAISNLVYFDNEKEVTLFLLRWS